MRTALRALVLTAALGLAPRHIRLDQAQAAARLALAAPDAEA